MQAVTLDDTTFYGLEHPVDGTPIGDILVRGRPIRSFAPDEFTSYEDTMEWAMAVFEAVPVGKDLEHIITPEFREAFYRHRNSFVDAETRDRDREAMQAAARSVFGEDAEIVQVFRVAHMGWESDKLHAIVRTGGALKVVGTDHGGPKAFTAGYLEGLLEGVREQEKDLVEALASL
jgi:hypothetical protein